MGYALAEELAKRGANVFLVSGPVALKAEQKNIERIDVVSAIEMYQKCIELFPMVDGGVMCAAVADFAPVLKSNEKIKRGKENFVLELQPNPDIAAALGAAKREGQLLVGFALETNDEAANAQKKLQKKNLDFIVLNSLNDSGAGFQTDTNKISIFDKHNKFRNFELKSKSLVAKDIVDQIEQEMSL
jgi:phosphopantothenoylcysteine decarboxylase/phosphopantothenate--cysteine ligase